MRSIAHATRVGAESGGCENGGLVTSGVLEGPALADEATLFVAAEPAPFTPHAPKTTSAGIRGTGANYYSDAYSAT
jgi:hypothetical protein